MDNSGTDITSGLNDFAEGTSYRAEITLTAQTGWSFNPNINFAYPGGSAVQPDSNNGAGSQDRRDRTLFGYHHRG
jgi:hypothetical protein